MDAEARPTLRSPLLLDPYIVATTLALVAFSIVMLYSTTGILSGDRFGDPLFFVKRQMAAAMIGVVAMWLASRVKPEFLQKISPYLLFVCIFLLILPLIPGLGDSAGGAKRWVKLGPVRFQPGEFVKVLFIIFMAGYFSRHEGELKGFVAGVCKPLLMVAVVGALLLKQPDFGSTAVIAAVTVAMATASGIRFRYLGIAAVVLAVGLGSLVIISPYRLSRIVSFLSPMSDASGKGYQLIQSLIAVGTGQLSGVGLGESQQKLFFLPAAHTDFLFAVIAEELGFFGSVGIIALFLIILWRGVKLAGRLAEDTFSFSLAVGLTMLIVLPALLNVGVVIGLLPTKGMVLPLVGYGGSSLIACLVVIGLLLSFIRSAHRQH
jgi:cell division protein FtsW